MGSYPIPDLSALHEQLASITPSGSSGDMSSLLAALEQQIQQAYPFLDATYIEKVVIAAMLTSLGIGERLYLPMLDEENFSKKGALPYLFWGLLYDGWAPDPETSGTTVFVTGYDDRNVVSGPNPNPPHNLRKRIYASATTPDLMPKYSQKITPFFEALFGAANAKQPLMELYLGSYFKDLYWNLHLGVTGTDVPDFAAEIGQSFNTVLANATPTMQLVYENYMNVRKLRPQLSTWLAGEVQRIAQNGDDTTLVHYWLKNSDNGQDPNFRTIDITFECFHDFVALSQWGNTLYNTMKLLNVTDGDPAVQQAFAAAMQAMESAAEAPPQPFDPLDRFIMELFRVISPNSASISTFTAPPVTNSPFEQYTYMFSVHAETSNFGVHWTDPGTFDPDRYLTCPTGSQNDPARSEALGFASCPFEPEHFPVADGRNVDLTNSVFGTVYSTVDGTESAICDYAGYAPFGYGYRRCPGELLNVQVMRDLLQIVWDQKLQFVNLGISNPVEVPVGPLAVVPDIYGFVSA